MYIYIHIQFLPVSNCLWVFGGLYRYTTLGMWLVTHSHYQENWGSHKLISRIARHSCHLCICRFELHIFWGASLHGSCKFKVLKPFPQRWRKTNMDQQGNGFPWKYLQMWEVRMLAVLRVDHSIFLWYDRALVLARIAHFCGYIPKLRVSQCGGLSLFFTTTSR